jgi:hypothetical protein
MKKLLLAMAFAGAATAGEVTGPLPPPPPPPSVTGGLFDFLGAELSLNYDSDHIINGHFLAYNWLSTTLDLAIPLSEQLSLDLSGTYGTAINDSDAFGLGEFDQLSGIAGLSYDLGAVQLSAGYRYWNFLDLPGGVSQHNEAFFGVGTSLFDGLLNFGIRYIANLDEENHYLDAVVSSEIVISDWLSLVPSANVGFIIDEGTQFWADNQGLSHVELRLAAPIKLTEYATLTPYAGYLFVLNAIDSSTVNTAGANTDRFFGGVSLSVRF